MSAGLCPYCAGTDVQHRVGEPCLWEEQERAEQNAAYEAEMQAQWEAEMQAQWEEEQGR